MRERELHKLIWLNRIHYGMKGLHGVTDQRGEVEKNERTLRKVERKRKVN